MSADTENRKRFCFKDFELFVRFQTLLKNCEKGRQIKLQKGMQEVLQLNMDNFCIKNKSDV